MTHSHYALAFVLYFATSFLEAPAQQTSPDMPDKPKMRWNIPTRTLGGKQFWTDELMYGEWRIQRHALSGHFRLLDPTNTRRAWGSWDDCLQQWQQTRQEQPQPPLKKRVVMVLHGLGRTRASMSPMATHLASSGDFSVLNFSYASTRATLAEDAASLAQVMRHLEGVEEINFVAHSMGNLVVRHFLGTHLTAPDILGNEQRLGRIVMLAPPNNGAALATRLERNLAFKVIFGNGGKLFTEQWNDLQEHLVTPPCQFGIIAGGSPDGEGHNPLLEGNDDVVVTVAETRLPGAHDFVVVPAAHTFIMNDETVQAYTLRFLEHGYFRSEDQRSPIDKP